MARRRSKDELKGQGVSLFLSGMSLADIAGTLSISLRTLTRWRREDRAAGADWDEQRSKVATWSPEALLARIRELIGTVLGDRSRPPERVADIVSKLVSAQDRLADRIGDVQKILDVLDMFTRWAVTHLSDARRAELAQDLDAFLDDIKSRCEGGDS